MKMQNTTSKCLKHFQVYLSGYVAYLGREKILHDVVETKQTR